VSAPARPLTISTGGAAPRRHPTPAVCADAASFTTGSPNFSGARPQRAAVGLDVLFDELSAARSPKDTIKWLGRSAAIPLLAQIARGKLPCTHETLDRHPSNPAIRRLEHLLVATGALPTRDPALARLERWTEELLAVHNEEPALRTFTHWVVLRRYRRKSQRALLNNGVLSRAKVEMRSAAAFLQRLAERGPPLEECGQADVDAWLAGDRADRYIARSFARWAMAQKLMPKLDFPAGWRGGPSPPIIAQELAELAQRLLHDPELSPRDRVASVLVAVFAQPVSRVARGAATANDSAATVGIPGRRAGPTDR
jgi:hypothetical protein